MGDVVYVCVQWLTGNISGLTFLLTFHAHLLCLFGPICNIYCLSQLR